MLSEFENGTVLLHDHKVSEGGVDITVREAKDTLSLHIAIEKV